MDIKLKKYSRARAARFAAFVLTVLCLAGIVSVFYNIGPVHKVSLNTAFENSYYQSQDCAQDYATTVSNLIEITNKYKSEQYIQSGGSIDEQELLDEENRLYREFQTNSKNHNPQLTREDDYKIFKLVYANEIANIKPNIIKRDILKFRSLLRELDKKPGILYLAQTEYGQYSNSEIKFKEFFKSFPGYAVFDSAEQSIFPQEIKDGPYGYWLTAPVKFCSAGSNDSIYVAFTGEYLDSRAAQWSRENGIASRGLLWVAVLSLILVLVLIYLVYLTGRQPDAEGNTSPNLIDRIYNDIKIILMVVVIVVWAALLNEFMIYKTHWMVFLITTVFSALFLTLLLSMVRHIKNKTFLKHSVIFTVFYKLFSFILNVYNSGSLAVKIVLLVIGYPILAALTFIMFPVTLGLAAWIALKRVKEFNAIKEGVKQVKEGNASHVIDIPGDGELARLASDINSISDGLGKAVENGIKSERLKSELISNVSHDIRTPLTSIITYVDLLKNEKDPAKTEEYIEVIDQKAQRLKLLTDDLFEAAKATSGSIPVCFENIEIVSLLKQGLGEMDDKIQERSLDFKLSHSLDKLYVKADGKLLWRAIENLFSNILKYALEGSRVYIDVIDFEKSVQVIIKNISAYELNISAEELMERFTRGDKSRSSQGSGLGLSIARSLIEIQRGSLGIEVDGDLFKAIIKIGKAQQG